MCDRPDNSASPSGRGSQTGTILSEKSQKFCRTVVRLDNILTYHSSCPFESSAYK
jgi:hypothetical protein